MIKITAPIELVPFKRPRFNGRTVFNDPKYSKCKDALGLIARKAMNGSEPLKGAIKISVTVCRPRKPDSRNFGDADNHLKTVLDALNGVCYVDDSQVTTAEVTLQQGAPCVTIELEETIDESIIKPSPAKNLRKYFLTRWRRRINAAKKLNWRNCHVGYRLDGQICLRQTRRAH